MSMQLNNINFELQRELELVYNKLAIAQHGLNVIVENGDTLGIARKTLEEIETI